jgi:hypothetical protein
LFADVRSQPFSQSHAFGYPLQSSRSQVSSSSDGDSEEEAEEEEEEEEEEDDVHP